VEEASVPSSSDSEDVSISRIIEMAGGTLFLLEERMCPSESESIRGVDDRRVSSSEERESSISDTRERDETRRDRTRRDLLNKTKIETFLNKDEAGRDDKRRDETRRDL
jgi:hypothetical protein